MSLPISGYQYVIVKRINPFILDTCSTLRNISSQDLQLWLQLLLSYGHEHILTLLSPIRQRLKRRVKVSESWFNQLLCGHPSVKSQLICRVRFVNRMDTEGHESRENLLRIDFSSRNHWIRCLHTGTRSIMTCVHTISSKTVSISPVKNWRKNWTKKDSFSFKTKLLS